MLKVTSLLSVIGLQELFLAAQDYNSTTFRTFEIFLVVAIYYIVMTTVWSLDPERDRTAAAGHGAATPIDQRHTAGAAVRRGRAGRW